MTTSEYTQQTEITPGQLVEQLVQYDGPPEAFLIRLLAVQCHIGNAEAGAIIRPAAGQEAAPSGQMEVLSLYPPLEEGAKTPPAWLAQAVELAPRILASRKPQLVPAHSTEQMYGVVASRYIALLPIWGKQGVRGVSAFLLPNIGPTEVENSRKRLELTITLLSLYELRLTLQRRKTDLTRLRQALTVLTAANEQKKYRAVAMAVCNHIASHFSADRVGVGILDGRYVKLQGLSHTEKFTRKMEAIQVIEAAMEECLDQDSEIVYPTPEGNEIVTRAAKELSQRHGQCNVLLLPLRRGDEPVGALSIERPADKPFSLEEAETLRVTCDLITPRFVELSESDRWFGRKWANATRKELANFLGPTHTWAKTAGIVALLLLLFAVFVPGTYKVKAPFAVKATESRKITAPYSGYLKISTVRPGDPVTANVTVLAQMETHLLGIERGGLIAQMNEARTNEQYHAFQHEIQFEQQEVRKLEDRILDKMEEAESLETNVRKAEEALKTETQKVQIEVAETQARVAEDERALIEHKARRDQLSAAVSHDALRLYEQVRRGHGGTAVAAALADRCQNCNVVFRPQFSYQVRSNENIMTCESCGLILYYDPPGAGVEDPAGDAGIVSG